MTIRLFWIGVRGIARGQEDAAAYARDGLITIVGRQAPGFAERIIDAAAMRFVEQLPSVPLQRARHEIGLDCCRLAPRIAWLDLNLVEPRGRA
jgi:hypothetical protein